MCVTKAGYLSEFNNVIMYTMFDKLFADKFGFTKEEVVMLLTHHQMNLNGVKAWYDGYSAANNISLYNPWSILSFIGKGTLAAHWVNTGKMGFILLLSDLV